MTPEQQIYHGDRAREVLKNEAYINAFDAIEQELTEQWKKSPPRDEVGREKIYMAQCMLQKLKTALESTMTSGKLATAELQHKRSLLDRARTWTGATSL